MRKGQKFTPKKMVSWSAEGRGTGTGKDYRPWHQIRRSDPASRGQSAIWFTEFDRQKDLLSGAERVGLCCVSRLKGVVDVLEQYPLPHADGPGVLARYSTEHEERVHQGTLALAKELRFNHPTVADSEGNKADWVMTSDLVVIIRDPVLRVVAVSVKNQAALNRREQQLLDIEKKYWQSQGATWLLLNLDEVSELVSKSLLKMSPHICATRYASSEVLDQVSDVAREHIGRLSNALDAVQRAFGCDYQEAQKRLWQAVWTGRIPVDLENDFCRAGRLTRVDGNNWCDWDVLKGVVAWV